jgi:hypothetical protein
MRAWHVVGDVGSSSHTGSTAARAARIARPRPAHVADHQRKVRAEVPAHRAHAPDVRAATVA